MNKKEKSTKDMVVNDLIKSITSGEYSIGDKLPTEGKLCEQFNVGRSTLREAISVVRALGYIETRHGSGSYIVATSVETRETVEQWFALRQSQLNDFFEVRCNIEVMNIRYAIMRRSEEDIEQIKAIHNSFENAIMRGDEIKMAMLDERFHTELARMSGNSLLIEINRIIANALKPYRRKSFTVEENAVHALFPHKNIITALENQDVSAGVKAMQEHIDTSLFDIASVANKVNKEE